MRVRNTLEDMAKLLDAAKNNETNVYLILEPTDLEAAPTAKLGTNLKMLEQQDSGLVVNVTQAGKRVI